MRTCTTGDIEMAPQPTLDALVTEQGAQILGSTRWSCPWALLVSNQWQLHRGE